MLRQADGRGRPLQIVLAVALLAVTLALTAPAASAAPAAAAHAKQQRGGYHVFVTSLETAKPVAGVKLAAITFNNQTLGEAETDEHGVALLKAPSSHPDGEAWLITGNLGNEDRVRDGGGPEIKGYVPSEGTVGWHDGEMIVKEGANKALIKPFLEQSQQAELIAEYFLANGRPLFNEKAYGFLKDQGKQDQADRYLYSKAPEVLPTMVLKGPGTSTDKSIQLFNEVFGGG